MRIFLNLVLALFVVVPVVVTAQDENTEPATEAAPETATTTNEQTESAVEPETSPPPPTGSVSRAQFTSGVANREPVDRLDSVSPGGKVYFFSELRDFAGQTVTHRWVYKGETKAEVPFSVGGNRWRVNSSKNLREDWDGTWEVHVVDGNGNTVAEYALSVTAPEVATEETEVSEETDIEAAGESVSDESN